MTTPKHISTEYQGGLPRMIGQSPAQEFTGNGLNARTGYVPKTFGIGARYYSSELSVDPLNILYPNLSPYVYCDNNPVYYKDPDGRTIVPHGSDEFKKQFAKDLEMIKNTDKGAKIVAFLQSPAFIINVTENIRQ
jgi:RHS repeat-associated protein